MFKKRPVYGRLSFWVISLMVIGAMATGWWLWRQIYIDSPRLISILISINREPRRFLTGETLTLHPNDRLEILKVSTSIPFNLDVRLVAEDLDVNALRYEEMTLSDLLPNRDAFNHYRFRVRVKHYNRDIGFMLWEVRPYTEDWLDKANRIIDNDLRLAFLERAAGLLPEDMKINHRLLDEYKSQKRWKRAAGMLERMAKDEGGSEVLSELLGVYRATKEKDGIISVLQRLTRLEPGDLATRRDLAEALEEKGDWNGAIQEYEAMLQLMDEKDRLPVYKGLGYLYTETNNLKKATSCYLKAAKIDQMDANIHYNLSYLYEKTNQMEKADFYLSNAITLSPGDLEGRLKLSEVLIKRGKQEEARRYLSEVLKKKPRSQRALVMMARIAEERGDKRELRGIYRKLLSLNPESETVIYNLGVLEYEEGNLKSALPHFEKYVKLHPKDDTVHGIIFDIHKRQENLPRAYEEALILAELRPEEPEIYDYIFDYLKERGNYEEIIPAMQKGLKARPKDVNLIGHLITAYLKTGKGDLAIEEMEALLKAKSKGIDGLLQELFEYLLGEGDYDKIIGVMEKAVKTYPAKKIIREYLVVAYLKTGKKNSAIRQMEAILKGRPKDVDLLLQLARLREKTGNLRGAAEAYKRIISISPEHKEASEAYLRLQLEGVGWR